MITYDFRGCVVGLLCILALVYFVSLLISPAPAQNMSQMGSAPWTKRADRAARLSYCMKLPDDFERQKCVEAIK